MVQAIKRDEVFIEPEGIHIETHQPERRSRKPPLLLVHGALTGSWLWNEFAAYLAERGWEAHAMNLRGHFTSDVADLAETTMRDYADDIGVAMRQLGRPAVSSAGASVRCCRVMHAERTPPVLGLVLLAPSPPAAALPRRPDEHELRAVPAVYDAAWWGWTGTREELRERMPDMDDARPREDERAPRRRSRVRPCPPRTDGGRRRSTRRRSPIRRSMVIGAGRDDVIHPTEARRTADLLGAGYEYFPSASHFGLVMGEHTWPEVAQSVLGWLEERRHAMVAASAAAVPVGARR